MSLLTLYDSTDCSPPGSSVHGILQATILEWVAVPSSGDLPNLGIKPAALMFSLLAGRFYTSSATWEAQEERYPSSNWSVPHHPFADSTDDGEASSHMCPML